jgi:F-type H+-transporting ATPase subunit epsilon
MALTVDIVTPERLVFSGPASEVLLPGWNGQFGALEQHELALALLRGGIIIAADQKLVVGRGFAEITGTQVTILVDHCENAGTVSPAQAQSDYTAAESALGTSHAGSADWNQATEQMELAQARMA